MEAQKDRSAGSGNAKSEHGPPQRGPVKRAGAVLSAFAVVSTAAKILTSLSDETLLACANLLLVGLAAGWVSRTVVHGILGYFFRSRLGGCRPWRLMAVSTLNALFAVLWLSASTFLLANPNGPVSAITLLIALVLAFVMSLWTLSAAQEAKKERGSEWIRGHLRQPLEPSVGTWLGCMLIRLIDKRTPPKRLSSFVAGTMALLLVALALTVPSSLSQLQPHAGDLTGPAKIGQAPGVPEPAEPEFCPAPSLSRS
jgi:hypothetical protein